MLRSSVSRATMGLKHQRGYGLNNDSEEIERFLEEFAEPSQEQVPDGHVCVRAGALAHSSLSGRIALGGDLRRYGGDGIADDAEWTGWETVYSTDRGVRAVDGGSLRGDSADIADQSSPRIGCHQRAVPGDTTGVACGIPLSTCLVVFCGTHGGYLRDRIR